MSEKRNRDNGSVMYARSYTHVNTNSTKILSIRNNGILKRKKFANDIRKTCEFKI